MCRSADCTVRQLQLLDTIRKADKDRVTGRKRERLGVTWVDRQGDRWEERQTDGQTGRKIDRWTELKKHEQTVR